MIAPALVDQIRQMLTQGELSQRKIAQRLGISRGTVNAIAQGKRTSVPLWRHGSDDYVPPAGPPRRCPGCGGIVLMPCLLCHVRAMKRRGR